MQKLTLYVGNKTYSSWSLRGWLMAMQTGAPFDEHVIPFGPPGTRTAAIGACSPSGRVPAIAHGELVVWDSLAIAEYLAEAFPAANLWPSDRAARAVARAVSAEMHSGFGALRTAMPMNVRRAPLVLPTTPEVDADVARILALWADCRRRFGADGPFLFGAHSNADSMFAPVASRFHTYGVSLDADARAYVDAVMARPAMGAWIDAAKREPWVIDHYEAVGRARS